MTAVFVNCLTVLIGSCIGLLFARRISPAVDSVVSGAAGVVTLVIGFSMAFSECNIVCLTLSLIAGGLIGTKLNIEGAVLDFGNWVGRLLPSSTGRAGNSADDPLQGKAAPAEKLPFGLGFLNASVLFCVGAMTIVGSFQAGLDQNYTVIYTKSVLDGFMAIIFAATFGAGTLLSVFSILLYQGALTMLASLLRPFMTTAMVNGLSAVGGMMVIMIGLGLLKLKDMKTANYLPSLIVMAVLILLEPAAGKIFAAII